MAQKQKSAGGLRRREILKYGVYGGLAASLSSTLPLVGCGKRVRGKGYNVLLISIDTLRADHVSCYGYKKATTPNIDRLASQGHRFSSAYTTIPSTLPAHASLLSSLYPRQLSSRRNGEKIPSEVTTLAEILRASGYNTAAFVSAAAMEARYGLNHGFQIYEDPGELIRLGAAEILVKATKWLENHKSEPFFLFVHFFDPHTPYYAPEHFRTRFGAPDRAVPPAIEFVPDPGLFTPTLIQETKAAYDATIAYADWAVGKLMQELEHLDLDKSTLVVLISDHGETLDELSARYGYFFDHGEFLYVHQLQIPLIIRMPGTVTSKEEVVHTDPVSITDIMPTTLESLDIEPPSSIAGLSLLPMLYSKKVAHGPVFSERRAFGTAPKPYMRGEDYSIIEGQWHLIFSTVRDSELYNLPDDPTEIFNVEHNAERIKTLRGKLQQWLEQTEPLFGPPMFETDHEALKRLRTIGYVG